MTRLEQEYMTRMPNEVRRLRESIDKFTEVLKPISEAVKNRPEITTVPFYPQTILYGLSGSVGEENPQT